MGLLQRIAALGQSQGEAEAEELRSRFGPGSQAVGALPVSSCVPGDLVCIKGTVSCVTIRAAGRAPGTDIEIYDGTGSVHVVWMGRRRIPGVVVGREIVVHGRMTCTTENPTIFNPRYELAPLAP